MGSSSSGSSFQDYVSATWRELHFLTGLANERKRGLRSALCAPFFAPFPWSPARAAHTAGFAVLPRIECSFLRDFLPNPSAARRRVFFDPAAAAFFLFSRHAARRVPRRTTAPMSHGAVSGQRLDQQVKRGRERERESRRARGAEGEGGVSSKAEKLGGREFVPRGCMREREGVQGEESA